MAILHFIKCLVGTQPGLLELFLCVRTPLDGRKKDERGGDGLVTGQKKKGVGDGKNSSYYLAPESCLCAVLNLIDPSNQVSVVCLCWFSPLEILHYMYLDGHVRIHNIHTCNVHVHCLCVFLDYVTLSFPFSFISSFLSLPHRFPLSSSFFLFLTLCIFFFLTISLQHSPQSPPTPLLAAALSLLQTLWRVRHNTALSALRCSHASFWMHLCDPLLRPPDLQSLERDEEAVSEPSIHPHSQHVFILFNFVHFKDVVGYLDSCGHILNIIATELYYVLE